MQLVRGWYPDGLAPLPLPSEQPQVWAMPSDWHIQASEPPWHPAYPGLAENISQVLLVFKTKTLFSVKSNMHERQKISNHLGGIK